MIRALAFDSLAEMVGGRAVRRAAFTQRSTLPLQAACLVANGVREQLAHLLPGEIELDVLEPTIPAIGTKHLLFGDALVYRVRAQLCDTFIVVRPADARGLAGAAFGEADRSPQRELSPIERQALDRIIAGIAQQCAPLGGAVGGLSVETPQTAQSECVTYFEVRARGSRGLGIGFGLTYDPAEEPAARFTLDDLLDVEIGASVELARGAITLTEFVDLQNGGTVALSSRLDDAGTLNVAGVRFARVACGASQGSHAVSILERCGTAA